MRILKIALYAIMVALLLATAWGSQPGVARETQFEDKGQLADSSANMKLAGCWRTICKGPPQKGGGGGPCKNVWDSLCSSGQSSSGGKAEIHRKNVPTVQPNQ